MHRTGDGVAGGAEVTALDGLFGVVARGTAARALAPLVGVVG